MIIDMKNRLTYIVLLIILSISFPSCDDWLSIKPEGDIVEDDFWQSEADVKGMVMSAYRFLSSANTMNRIVIWGEFRSDNISLESSASNDERNIFNVNILPANGLTSWGDFYKVINICNLILEKAPAVRERDLDFSENALNNYLAEALTIRSLCFFYLVRVYGRVPLVLEATISENQNMDCKQSDESVVLEQIIKDLILAEEYAAIQWESNALTKGRVTRNAVRALLADVYLWNMQYDECINACDRILDDKSAMLELVDGKTMFSDVFGQGNSTESIFELNFSINGQRNDATASLYGNPQKNRSPHVKASPGLYNSYKTVDQLDIRGKDFLGSSNRGYRIYKYEAVSSLSDFSEEASFPQGYYRSASSTSNWIFYRLPDIYLIKAEALSEKEGASETDYREALALVNLVYERATLNNDSYLFDNYSSGAAIKKLILEERRREFAFEGKRWFDLLRKVRKEESTIDTWNILALNYEENVELIRAKLSNKNAWYLPVNQNEMSLNPNLVQNPFYQVSGY